jgi:tetratricopeptide (TPR) repeat protein
MNRLILIAIIGAASLNILAERNDCSNCTVYKAYISGDMSIWKSGMTAILAAYDRSHDACLLFTLAEARYGYIGFMLGTEKKREVRPLIDTFESDIEKLSKYREYAAETEAFRIALLGFRMGLNPALSVTLGPKALKQIGSAMETDSLNAAVWIEKANSEVYMPAFAGGSKAKAAASFRKALSLFETGEGLSDCNWRYLNTMVLLGQLLEKMEDFAGARDIYKKALSREPEFRWVRDELLPAVEKKIK